MKVVPLSRLADSDRLQCAPTVVVELHLIRQGLADILGQQPGKALVDLLLGRLVLTILAQEAHQTQPLFYALRRSAPVNRRSEAIVLHFKQPVRVVEWGWLLDQGEGCYGGPHCQAALQEIGPRRVSVIRIGNPLSPSARVVAANDHKCPHYIGQPRYHAEQVPQPRSAA